MQQHFDLISHPVKGGVIDDPFESPRFLIAQISQNIAEFDTIRQRFFDVNPGRLLVDYDVKTGNKVYKITFGQPLPMKLRSIAAAGIVDLRHSLDQATCAAVEQVTGRPASNRLYFPFASNPKDLRGRLSKEIPPELHPTFLAFESYPTGHDYTGGSDLLCDLSKAAQRKHRISANIDARIANMSFYNGVIPGGVVIGPHQWDGRKNELMIATCPRDKDITTQIRVNHFVCFGNAGPLTGRPVIETLLDLTAKVRSIVSDLETSTNRILSGKT
jgi:hypothetical protein